MLILVAEDDDDFRELIASILKSDDCMVDLVPDGLEAIRAVAGSKYDLVMTDFDMPGLDGIALSRSIHDLQPSTPVVMVTGKPLDSDQKAEIHAAGITKVIRKPFKTSEILEIRNAHRPQAQAVAVAQRS